MTTKAAKAPIGIFDSGLGGLTVLRAFQESMPNEGFLYLGDTARVPYGNKSPESIKRYTTSCARFLKARGVKALVLACNTASAYTLQSLQESMDIPVFGVIDPVASLAVKTTKSGTIGVIGTKATIASDIYHFTLKALNSGVKTISTACPLFVPLVEEGWAHHPITLDVCREYLRVFEATPTDTIIMACTHYPILRDSIERCLKEMHLDCLLCDSGRATADSVYRKLSAISALRSQKHQGSVQFMVTADASNFVHVGQQFIGESLQQADLVLIPGLDC